MSQRDVKDIDGKFFNKQKYFCLILHVELKPEKKKKLKKKFFFFSVSDA